VYTNFVVQLSIRRAVHIHILVISGQKLWSGKAISGSEEEKYCTLLASIGRHNLVGTLPRISNADSKRPNSRKLQQKQKKSLLRVVHASAKKQIKY
jgi:hypothetical protein